MPYLFCLFKEEAIKNSNSFSEAAYATNPELVAHSGQSLDVTVVATVADLTKVNYAALNNQIRFYCPGTHKQVLYCIKVTNSKFPVDEQQIDPPFAIKEHRVFKEEQFRVGAIEDIIGCIVYSLPRILDGISYCVANAKAEEADRIAFIKGAEILQNEFGRKFRFARELKISKAEFTVPIGFIIPKKEAVPEPSKNILSDVPAEPSSTCRVF